MEFLDGNIREYDTNVIAENLYASTDDQGFTKTLFDDISDHRKDERAINKADA